MRNKQLIALIMALLALFCAFSPAMAQEEENLLKNGSFEQVGTDGLPYSWYTDAYIRQEGYTTYSVSDDVHDGSHSAVVNNIGMNDARFAQKVDVVPNSLYCLSGWIKVDDMLDGGRGANLSIEGVYVFSESVFEADGQWHYVELYGETGEDQYEVIVFARVGGYSGESQGKASFDDLCLREVDAVPGDGIATLWFRQEQPVAVDPVDEEEGMAAPAWPWLLVVSAVYLAMGVWLYSYLMLDRHELSEPARPSMVFWAGLALAAFVRIVVAVLVEGYQVDVNCFRSWGNTFAKVGPAAFYQTTSFCDYTPAYIYIMGLSDWLASVGYDMGLRLLDAFYHKIVPMLCDLAGAFLVYRLAREEKFSRAQAELFGLFVALNPAMLINSAAWCQIDSVLCLGLMVVAWLAVRRKWAALLPVYVLCALIKPQALMLGPLGLLVIIIDWIKHKENGKQLLIGLGLSAVVAAVIIVPFGIHQQPGWLIGKYMTTLSSYAYATVNTANFYYLFGANWASIGNACGWLPAVCMAMLCLGWAVVTFLRQKELRFRLAEPIIMAVFALAYLVMAFMDVTWGTLGTATMVLAFAIVLPMYIRSGNVRHVPLLGAVLFILLYTMGIKMHERYLFPALFLLATAFVLHRNWSILTLLAVLSCTVLINEGIVLDNSLRLGSSQGHLNQDTLGLCMGVSAVNVACMALSVWTAFRVCVEKTAEKLQDTVKPLLPVPHYEEKPQDTQAVQFDHRLHWKRLDWILMLSVTAIYAAVCLCNLGSTKAPQNAWTSTAYNESVVIDLGEEYEQFSMLYFCQVSYNDFSVAVSADGESWSQEHWAQMKQGECFRWKYLAPSYTNEDGTHSFSGVSNFAHTQKLTGRYVRITAQQISLYLNEVIFCDANGEQILGATIVERENANLDSPLLSDPKHLLDEQDSLEGEPGWFNSTYFDEIYHARTAFEHLKGYAPYETSHPPLGKVIMSWFVGLFGMTPFGWRFAGALAGILMLPAMYLLGKQITKRTDMAFAAMAMMTLDCMHFTQTRIATIDSFPVLFIILSYLFMARFMQRDILKQSCREILPDLALCGFFMGCGVASKWIGVYAGLGLAVLYFWTCMRHLRLASVAQRTISKSGRKNAGQPYQDAWRRIIILCLWCLLFFVAVPVAIYLLAYVPYFAYAHKEGFIDYVNMVINANEGMLNYHSTPRLGMDHPFYSPWYEWPLIKRPMYYAMASFVPEGYSYSIFCFGNPAVWLAGLAGLAATLWTWAKRHCYTLSGSNHSLHLYSDQSDIAPAFVLIGFLAQFLPWVLVPRGTYIYHYFASIPFLILATMLLLHWLSSRWPRTGRIVMIVFLAVCLVMFVAFYPYASGVLTPEWWLEFMKKFLHVYYA